MRSWFTSGPPPIARAVAIVVVWWVMGEARTSIATELAEWISRQRVFFVASAPLDAEGSVNLSPKGYDTLRIIDATTIAYLDLTGSGAETIAHVRENGRITIMWCAFEGPARIVRVHGRAEVVDLDDERIAGLFGPDRGARAVLLVHVHRVADSCGYAVPLMEYRGERERLRSWVAGKSDDELDEYRRRKNARSLDGLPALDG